MGNATTLLPKFKRRAAAAIGIPRRLFARIASFLRNSTANQLLCHIRLYPNWYLNLIIWMPFISLLSAIAVYSRLRHRKIFAAHSAGDFPFFETAPESARWSLEFYLQKTLEGQQFYLHRDKLVHPILDIGTGEGTFAYWFRDAICQIDAGIDPMEIQHQTAGAMGSYKEVKMAPAECIPYPDNSFNTVMSVCVLEHVEGIDRAFKEMARVLRPGGHILATVISENHSDALLPARIYRFLGLHRRADEYTRRFNCMNMHHRPTFSVGDYQTLVGSDLSIVQHEYFLSRSNRSFYDFLGWPAILIGYRYGNVSVSMHLLRKWLGNKPIDRFARWLLLPRLYLDAAQDNPRHTFLFLAMKKQ